MKFIMVDVETANSNQGSICQIGMVKVENWEIVSKGSMLIDPKADFDAVNIGVHGIRPEQVVGKPTFVHAHAPVKGFFDEQVVFSHSTFDQIAFDKACDQNDLPRFDCHWMDSTRVVRKTWAQFSQRGYGLRSLADHIGFEFGHHDALEDALAATAVLLAALKDKGWTLDQWKEEIGHPIKVDGSVSGAPASNSVKGKFEPNPDGSFFKQGICFTGAVPGMSRNQARDAAAKLGFTIVTTVSKKCNVLVAGELDPSVLAEGASKSSKLLKAEERLANGEDIRILSPIEFAELFVEGG
ncbi:exonuclease domain-containing protein [Maritalea sp.]|uniref:exonuclease domain-containing protein n=1 Tax=Maritalea sp. TaxID=2003361 RepID=UPI003EF3F279